MSHNVVKKFLLLLLGYHAEKRGETLKQTGIYNRNLCQDCIHYEQCKAIAGEEVEACYCVDYAGKGREVN